MRYDKAMDLKTEGFSIPTKGTGISRLTGLLREPFCGISHFTGAALSLVGLVALLTKAHGDPLRIVAFSLYGGSLVLLYLASAFAHSVRAGQQLFEWLCRFDYIGIFLLVAGTCAPFCLLVLHGALGWTLFGVIYGLASLGIANVLFSLQTPHWKRIIVYFLMGLTMLVAVGPLLTLVPHAALIWMLVGGLVYAVGVTIMVVEKPSLWPGRFNAHDLWHIFVLAASACHFYAIWRYIALAP